MYLIVQYVVQYVDSKVFHVGVLEASIACYGCLRSTDPNWRAIYSPGASMWANLDPGARVLNGKPDS